MPQDTAKVRVRMKGGERSQGAGSRLLNLSTHTLSAVEKGGCLDGQTQDVSGQKKIKREKEMVNKRSSFG